MEYVSFPGLGIEPFNVDPVAFRIGDFPIMWYGIIICFGMILGFIYALTRAKIEKIKSDDIYDLAIFAIIFGIIGARLYYVLFEIKSYTSSGTFFQILKRIISIRDGGLAIYGGIIAGFITVLIVSKVKKMRFSTLLDVVAPAVMIGQMIGRFGNFMNMEAYGSETTLPWRMGLLASFDQGESFFSEMYVHPTFLYESLWNLIGFIIIHSIYKKKKFNGQIFLFYMSWYGLGRMFIEGLRTDSLMIGPFRVSQLVAAATFALGIVLTVVNFVNLKHYEKSLAADKAEDNGEKPENVTESVATAEENAEDTTENNTEENAEENTEDNTEDNTEENADNNSDS